MPISGKEQEQMLWAIVDDKDGLGLFDFFLIERLAYFIYKNELCNMKPRDIIDFRAASNLNDKHRFLLKRIAREHIISKGIPAVNAGSYDTEGKSDREILQDLTDQIIFDFYKTFRNELDFTKYFHIDWQQQ